MESFKLWASGWGGSKSVPWPRLLIVPSFLPSFLPRLHELDSVQLYEQTGFFREIENRREGTMGMEVIDKEEKEGGRTRNVTSSAGVSPLRQFSFPSK